MDEKFTKANYEWVYLYSVIDSNGDTINFRISRNRCKTVAKHFLPNALWQPHITKPRVFSTDWFAATECAIIEVQRDKCALGNVKHGEISI